MNKQLLLLTISSIATVMLLVGSPQEAEAAGYLKIGDIKGESTDVGYEGSIDLLEISHSIDRSANAKGASGAARERSNPSFGDIVVVKEVDASTPKLQEAVADGKNFLQVKIDLTRDLSERAQPYLEWELKNVRVTSYSISGSTDGHQIPTESISLNFEEIKVTYTKIKEDGTTEKISYSWNLAKGTK
jgi:type VI secretion system secreted protein Hcp